MAVTPVSYEAFDEDPPSYVPSYIMSAFVLVAVVGLAVHGVPAWPPTAGHVFLVIWFGILFRWMLLNARAQRLFLSDRLSVTNEAYRHTFRYAVSEATHVEIPVADIEEVRLSTAEPRRIEVIGKGDGDLYFLPRAANIDDLVAALTAANPAIRVTRD